MTYDLHGNAAGVGGALDVERTSIDDTDSPYATKGEQIIHVDTTNGAVTIEVQSADIRTDHRLKVVDTGLNAGTNAITLTTEGAETFNPGAASTLTIGLDGGHVSLWSDGSNLFTNEAQPATATEQADITGETFIIVTRGSDSNAISSNTWTNIADGEAQDNRNEFNASQQFVPDESGWYGVYIHAAIDPGADQDLLRARFWDTTNTVAMGQASSAWGRMNASGTGDLQVLEANQHVNLTAGDAYEFQVQDFDSSFDLRSASTFGTIKRSVVHP